MLPFNIVKTTNSILLGFVQYPSFLGFKTTTPQFTSNIYRSPRLYKKKRGQTFCFCSISSVHCSKLFSNKDNCTLRLFKLVLIICCDSCQLEYSFPVQFSSDSRDSAYFSLIKKKGRTLIHIS